MRKRLVPFFLSLVVSGGSLFTSPSAAPPSPSSVVIIGGGIGALTSAIYLERAGIHVTVIEGRDPGGAIAQSPLVENWPGEIGIDGPSLIEKVRKQAEFNGASLLSKEVISVDFSQKPYKIVTRSLTDKNHIETLYTNSCIIATGSAPKKLNVPGESAYWTRGVYTCATCDGALYKNKTVVVVGGGDAALVEAEYLSKIAKKVVVLVRGKGFRSKEIGRKNALLQSPNVEVLFQTTVEEIHGNAQKATELLIRSAGVEKKLEMDALFLAIGSIPNSSLFEGQIERDAEGYIVLKGDQSTSKEGVFAIGDVADPFFNQAITSAATGAKAASQAVHYLAALSTPSPSKTVEKAAQPPSVQVVSAPLEEVIELINADQLSDLLTNSHKTLLVDFYSPYCGPCRKISPAFSSAAKNYAGKIQFVKVNVSQISELASDYNVYGVPTIIVFNSSGQEVERRTGIEEINTLLNSLDKYAQ